MSSVTTITDTTLVASPLGNNKDGGGDDTKSSSPDQIATCVDGKFFWHHKDIDLATICTHLPDRCGRNIFGVTFFEPFLFYHDRDLTLKKTQAFVVRLFKSLQESEQQQQQQIDESQLKEAATSSKPKIFEYLVTRNPECLTKCKFERLGKSVGDENDKIPGTSKKKNRKSNEKKSNDESTLTTTDETTNTKNEPSEPKKWTINTWLQGNQGKIKQIFLKRLIKS